MSNDPDPYFEMLDAPVSRIDWSFDAIMRHLLRWLKQVSCGRNGRQQTFVEARFVEGGTIGPAAGLRPTRG